MNALQELSLHVESLSVATETKPEFFASVIHYVRRLKELLTELPDQLTQGELQVLTAKIEEFFAKWRPTGDGFYFPPRETADCDDTVQQLNILVARLTELNEAEFADVASRLSGANRAPQSRRQAIKARSVCVFIGHGRSKVWTRVKMYLEDECRLATISYESESRTGESIVPVLEKMLEQSTFAVVVLTAEDEVQAGKRRPRQNVVHEAGLFQGRLGFRRAVLLLQEGIEGFTNIDGLQHIPFSGDNVEQAFYELQRVLKREQQIP